MTHTLPPAEHRALLAADLLDATEDLLAMSPSDRLTLFRRLFRTVSPQVNGAPVARIHFGKLRDAETPLAIFDEVHGELESSAALALCQVYAPEFSAALYAPRLALPIRSLAVIVRDRDLSAHEKLEMKRLLGTYAKIAEVRRHAADPNP